MIPACPCGSYMTAPKVHEQWHCYSCTNTFRVVEDRDEQIKRLQAEVDGLIRRGRRRTRTEEKDDNE